MRPAGRSACFLSSAAACGGVFLNTGAFTMEGGTISGNSAPKAGGLYVSENVHKTFTKTGGTIYGGNDTTHDPIANPGENTATGGQGHAVYWHFGPKKRDTTVGSNDHISITGNSFTGPDPFWD